ncbi:MAG: MFS transporter [Alicyclobacillus macrosporangiidus]|nr:MFS transporter [Alicyclobacillus macrosporangiidus]
MKVQRVEQVNVSELIDANRISGYQVVIIVLCGVVAMLDGYDLQVVSFVAPVLSKLWHVEGAAMAPVFSAGLFGLMLGALISGPMADRFGRKLVVVYSALAFGVFSILTVAAHGISALMVFRFLTGLGLGGSMPNIISLTAEYSPARIRKAMISAMFLRAARRGGGRWSAGHAYDPVAGVEVVVLSRRHFADSHWTGRRLRIAGIHPVFGRPPSGLAQGGTNSVQDIACHIIVRQCLVLPAGAAS